MVLQNICYIKNPNVNSGVNIDLKAKSINTTWAVLTTTINKPRVTVASDYSDSLSPGTNQGFANPTHTITGVVDLSADHSSTVIDYQNLLALINNADQVVTLQSDKFKTTSNPTGVVNCMLKNYSDSLMNTNVLDYTLVLVEVYS